MIGFSVLIYRAGDWANLIIKYFVNKKEEIVRGRRSLKLDNPKIVFNKDSDLIVGGVPVKMKLPSKVEAVNYTGCIDGLEMNYHFVGSWNTEVCLSLQVKLSYLLLNLTYIKSSV